MDERNLFMFVQVKLSFSFCYNNFNFRIVYFLGKKYPQRNDELNCGEGGWVLATGFLLDFLLFLDLFDFSFNVRVSLLCYSLNDLENSCELNDDDGTPPLGSGSNIVDEKWIFNQVSKRVIPIVAIILCLCRLKGGRGR